MPISAADTDGGRETIIQRRAQKRAGAIRSHKVKIIIEYEGEPLHKLALDKMMAHLGADCGVALRMRHRDADGVYVLGATHEQGEG